MANDREALKEIDVVEVEEASLLGSLCNSAPRRASEVLEDTRAVWRLRVARKDLSVLCLGLALVTVVCLLVGVVRDVAPRSSKADVLGLREVNDAAARCHDAICGEVCYQHVQMAMRIGIAERPNLFKGLLATSSLEEFQEHLHRAGLGLCEKPCSAAVDATVESRRSFSATQRVVVDEGLPLADYADRNYSLLECELLCSRSPRCHSFAYARSVGRCHLKERCIGPNDAVLGASAEDAENKTDFRTYYDTSCSTDKEAGTSSPATAARAAQLPSSAPAAVHFSARCATAGYGSECYDRVASVQRSVLKGGWYDGITAFSSSGQVQQMLHMSGEGNCPQPCDVPTDPSALRLAAAAATAPAEEDLGAICSGELGAPEEEEARTLEQQSPAVRERCFDRLVLEGLAKDEDEKEDRDWCWVGLKALGCHKHFHDHLTWAEMQRLSGFSVPFQPLDKPAVCDRQVFGGQQAWTAADWAASKKWFRRHVAVYVLSLASSWDRRQTVQRRLDDIELPFEFVDGVDMQAAGALRAAQRDGHVPSDFDFDRAQANAYKAKQGMGETGSIVGTVGCAAAHFKAQRHAAKQANATRNLVVILEDDVAPEFDFVPRLWRLVTKELPCDWQAVSLTSRCPFGRCVSPHLTRVQPDIHEPEWRCRHGVNYGFQGMLYRASEIEALQKLWKPVVFDEERPHCLDVDVALASISDKVSFYAVPHVQDPGFLRELHEGSSRIKINLKAEWSAPPGGAWAQTTTTSPWWTPTRSTRGAARTTTATTTSTPAIAAWA